MLVSHPGMPLSGDLAVVSQSGAIAAGMVEWASQRTVGFSAIVSIGDQLDVDFGDLLDFFAFDRCNACRSPLCRIPSRMRANLCRLQARPRVQSLSSL